MVGFLHGTAPRMKNIWVPKGWHMSSEPLPSTLACTRPTLPWLHLACAKHAKLTGDYRLESSTLAKYEDGSVGGGGPDVARARAKQDFADTLHPPRFQSR